MIALVAIFTMGMSINAQQNQQRQGQGQGRTPADRVERLAQQITLSADEKAKVLELFEKQQKRNQEAFAAASAAGNNQNVDREAMRTRMQEQQKADDADLEAIIGKEKMAQYQKIREEQRASRGQGQGQRQRN